MASYPRVVGPEVDPSQLVHAAVENTIQGKAVEVWRLEAELSALPQIGRGAGVCTLVGCLEARSWRDVTDVLVRSEPAGGGWARRFKSPDDS